MPLCDQAGTTLSTSSVAEDAGTSSTLMCCANVRVTAAVPAAVLSASIMTCSVSAAVTDGSSATVSATSVLAYGASGGMLAVAPSGKVMPVVADITPSIKPASGTGPALATLMTNRPRSSPSR